MRRILRYALATGLLLLLGAFLLVGWVVYQGIRQARAYARLTDTRNLGARIDEKAAAYSAKHPQARLVVGVLKDGRRRVRGYGPQSPRIEADLPAGKELFEIGSITKVFTAVLLTRLDTEGRIGLDDPIGRFLPDDLVLPGPAREITLKHLATHTSGLPRLPANLELSPRTAANPYRDYKPANLYEALRTVRLDQPPGRRAAYSNLGAGLLGHLLERQAGEPFERLVRREIAEPLGMDDTTITLTEDQQRRLQRGHDPKTGAEVPNWDMDALAGAGALRSTADDLLTFLEANLAPPDDALGKALARARELQHDGGVFGNKHALGWIIQDDPFAGVRVHWHNGGTGGYVSFLGLIAERKLAVVLLSSSGDALAGDDAVDRMGLAILREATKVSLEEE